jgi:branched-chain amino acid transport system permease protein
VLVTYLQAVLSGLALGAVYALVALSFSIAFTTTRTLNFSQGEVLAFGAFIGVTAFGLAGGAASGASGMGYAVALVAGAVITALVCVLLFILAVRPFAGQGNMNWVMSTIGFGVILQSLGLAIWGPAPAMLPPPFRDDVISIFGAGVRSQEILVFVAAVGIMAALDLLMRRSRVGKAMRAVAHSPATASLMGINVTAYMVAAFALSGALAGTAGVLVAPIASASLFMGLGIALKAFSAAMIGGLTNPRGCMYGGLMLGVAESIVALWQAQWREIVVFGLIILVLALRPQGLFARRILEKV